MLPSVQPTASPGPDQDPPSISLHLGNTASPSEHFAAPGWKKPRHIWWKISFNQIYTQSWAVVLSTDRTGVKILHAGRLPWLKSLQEYSVTHSFVRFFQKGITRNTKQRHKSLHLKIITIKENFWSLKENPWLTRFSPVLLSKLTNNCGPRTEPWGTPPWYSSRTSLFVYISELTWCKGWPCSVEQSVWALCHSDWGRHTSEEYRSAQEDLEGAEGTEEIEVVNHFCIEISLTRCWLNKQALPDDTGLRWRTALTREPAEFVCVSTGCRRAERVYNMTRAHPAPPRLRSSVNGKKWFN